MQMRAGTASRWFTTRDRVEHLELCPKMGHLSVDCVADGVMVGHQYTYDE